MNYSPTLSADEFKDVHNAKCELYCLMQDLDGIVHPMVQDRLKKVLDLLDRGLKGAYEQDDEVFKAAQAAGTAAAERIGAMSIWSMHEVTEFSSEHPYGDVRRLKYNDHEVEITGSTWLDLYRAADKVIRLSGDEHHIFIEDFRHSAMSDKILVLGTGS